MQQRTLFAFSALALALGACTGVIGDVTGGPEEQDVGGAGGAPTNPIATNSSSGQTSTGNGGNGVTSSSSGGNMASSSGDMATSSSASSSSSAASSSSSSAGSSASSSASSSSGGPVCGNLTCEMGESCADCAGDCGKGSGAQTTDLDSEEMAFVTLINQHRASNGVGPIKTCVTLNRAAQGHSEDMRDKNYFSHSGLNGSSFVDRSCDACYSFACPLQTAMGENIAAGNADAQNTFTQWKNSSGHNMNMLSASYKFMGIGRATGGGQYGVYWTNVFGGNSDGTCN